MTTLQERMKAVRIITKILVKEFPSLDLVRAVDIAAKIVEALDGQ